VAFTVPNFNVFCDIWYTPRAPADGPPDVANVPCQFYLTPKGQTFIDPPPFTFFPLPIYVRIPIANDADWRQMRVAEIPPGSGFYYRASWKERVHLGFPNEYRVIIVAQCDDTGTVITKFVDDGGGGGGATADGVAGLFLAMTPAGTATRETGQTATGAADFVLDMAASGTANNP